MIGWGYEAAWQSEDRMVAGVGGNRQRLRLHAFREPAGHRQHDPVAERDDADAAQLVHNGQRLTVPYGAHAAASAQNSSEPSQ